MNTIQVQCRQCKRRFAAKPQLAGKQVKCPGCQKPIAIPDPDLVTAVIATLEVTCSMCQNEYLAESSDVGRQIPCPSCGMLNAVTDGSSVDEYKLQDPFSGSASTQGASPFGGRSRPTAAPVRHATFQASASSGGSDFLARHWPSGAVAVIALVSLIVCLVSGHPIVGVMLLGAGVAVAGSGFVFPPPKRRRQGKSSGGVVVTFMSSAGAVVFFIGIVALRVLGRMNRRGQLEDQQWLGPVLAGLFVLVVLAGLIGLFIWVVSRFGIFRAGAAFYSFVAIGAPVLLLSLDPAGLGLDGKREFAQKELPKPLAETAMPGLGMARPIGTGIDFHQVFLPVPPSQPGHANKLFVYVPQGSNPPRSRPCIFIAGAGAPPLTGMDLGTADQPEHIPYAEQGFVVVAYEVDGYVQNPETATDAQYLEAVADYWSADVGLVNARNAIDFALARIPAVDPGRLYTAGHSSAGIQALLLAENDSRIRGCVAYAPVVNLQVRIGSDLATFRRLIDDFDTLLNRASPWENADRLKCPTMLFHALDDQNVPVSESRDLAGRLERARTPVTLVTVGRGGHYDSMISEGIPRGIEWLQTQAGMGTHPAMAATRSSQDDLASSRGTPPGTGLPGTGLPGTGTKLPALGMGGMQPRTDSDSTTARSEEASSGLTTPDELDSEDPFAESSDSPESGDSPFKESESPFRETTTDSEMADQADADDSPFKEVPSDSTGASISASELDRLLDKMSGNPLEQRAALQEIGKTSPEGLSPELRDKATEKLNEMAVGADHFTRTEAIRALGKWGDERSARMLVGILMDGRNRGVSADVYKALGQLKDPSSAIAVAERLDDFFDRDKAEACLHAMGPVAEDALIAIAPTAKKDGCLRALRLLGTFGTEKCINVLRDAQESRDPAIRQVGKAAIRAVRLRQKAEEGDGSGSEGGE